MSEDKNLRARILMEGAKGNLPEDEAHAMLSVLSGASILKPVPSEADRALGRDGIYETLDADGNLLVAGENYMLRDEKVKVLREQHGAGNMLDVYMRVFYLDSSLEERFTVVDGKYPNGVFNGAVYKSQFKPIQKE